MVVFTYWRVPGKGRGGCVVDIMVYFMPHNQTLSKEVTETLMKKGQLAGTHLLILSSTVHISGYYSLLLKQIYVPRILIKQSVYCNSCHLELDTATASA